MLQAIRKALHEPRMTDVSHDCEERVALHRRIVFEKRMVREVFEQFYDICITSNKKYFSGEGLEVELGAGSSFFKTRYPHIVSTDIQPAAHLDRVLDAQALDLPDRSARAFYAINCLHHLPQPKLFFEELKRTLVPGGGCVLIDPYYSPFSRIFHANLHAEEVYDWSQKDWEFQSPSPGVIANQALSWIIFVRDRAFFESRYPELEIVDTHVIGNYPRYLFSGGLNFRQLLPDALTGTVKFGEVLLSPLKPLLGLHWAIVIRKKE